MQMKAQASQLRIAGCLSKSTDVMKSMQQLVKMPEIQKTMMEMSKEMMKVNISGLSPMSTDRPIPNYRNSVHKTTGNKNLLLILY